MWRVTRADPKGLHLWFDPDIEFPRLYELEPRPEDGVAIANEGDDQRGLFDEVGQVTDGLPEGDLPF